MQGYPVKRGPKEMSSAGHPVLLGRERTLALLAEHLNAGTCCALVGESGIGKSTLAAAVAQSESQAFVGGGLATLSWLAYLPLRRAFGVEPYGDATAVADDVAARVGDGLLVIDDLQWVDAPTRQVLELLGGRVRLLLAVRSDDPGANKALELCDLLGAARVEPEPLERDDALALVRAVRTDLAGPLALRLVERAGGNPLFLRELAAAGEVSASFRLALAARIRSLSPAARDSLALLALLGRPAERALLGDGADELVARDFADETDDGLVAIRHALFAEAALAELADPTSLHVRLAEHLDGRAEAAHHFAAAGMPERAATLALAAAEEASTQPERAELLALAARCEHSTDLALRAARELEACGLYGAAAQTVELAFPLTGRDRARAACVLWNIRYELGDLEGAAAEIGVGLAEAGDDTRLRAELTLADANVALFDERRRNERLEKTAAALALVRDDDELRPWARRTHGTALYLAADPGAVDELERAAEESRRSGDVDGELRSLYNAIAAAEAYSQQARARKLALTGIERAREFRLATRARELRVTLVNLDGHAGRYDAVVREGTALLAEGLDARRRDTVLVLLAVALIDTGRFAEAEEYVAQLLTRGAADIRGHGMGQWLRAEAQLWGGDPRAALTTIGGFLSRADVGQWEAFGRGVEAWARHELGLPPTREWEPDDTLPPILKGFVHELDGLALLAEGDGDGAAARFRTGADLFAASHVRGELRCLLGEALAREDVELLLALEARAEEHELAPLLARVQRALRLLGVRRSAPRGDARAGLTARESEVLGLAAAGLTNDAIARRLGIGHSTVKRLVASGARKLGADTRAQAVARFART
jgi:DNA-binding CsgD family transcriptional regulator